MSEKKRVEGHYIGQGVEIDISSDITEPGSVNVARNPEAGTVYLTFGTLDLRLPENVADELRAKLA